MTAGIASIPPGMMWLDDGPAALSEKIAKAAVFFEQKYGHAATVCRVHPDVEVQDGAMVAGLMIVKDKATLASHFFLTHEKIKA